MQGGNLGARQPTHRLEAAAQGMWSQEAPELGAPTLTVPHDSTRTCAPPPLVLPAPSVTGVWQGAAGGFEQAREVVLGFEQPGSPWLRELRLENTGLHQILGVS